MAEMQASSSRPLCRGWLRRRRPGARAGEAGDAPAAPRPASRRDTPAGPGSAGLPDRRLVSAVRGRRGASGRDVGATAVLRADGGKRRGARRYGARGRPLALVNVEIYDPAPPGGAATGRLTMLGEMVVGERVDQAGCDWCQ